MKRSDVKRIADKLREIATDLEASIKSDASVLTAEKWIGIAKVAKILGVSIFTLRAWDANGKLPATRVSEGMRRYPEAQISAFLKNKTPRDAVEKNGDGFDEEPSEAWETPPNE